MSKTTAPPLYIVKESPIHGRGVFARHAIPAGTRIVEYTGERISSEESTRRAQSSGGPVNHTFFFSLADGMLIDGGSGGNDARWINHACEPNCEAYEEDGKVFIYSLQDIEAGEELNYNYALIYEARHTPAIKRAFACHCGAPSCTGLMLAPKRRRRKAAATTEAEAEAA
jgi:SET domain-containing protein